MQNSIRIENSLYEEMRKHPFFFIKLHAEKSYDNRGKQEVHYKWVSVNHKDKIEFSVDNLEIETWAIVYVRLNGQSLFLIKTDK